MRINYRQRLVKQERIHVFAHHATTKRYLLLGICSETSRLVVQAVLHADHRSNLLHASFDISGISASVAQWKCQVIAHGHCVVDHWKLENLRNIALSCRFVSDIFVVEQNTPLTGMQQAGNDIEQSRLTATRRPKQGIGFAIRPIVVHFL